MSTWADGSSTSRTSAAFETTLRSYTDSKTRVYDIVEDYGAAGDGTTNDTTALQSALTDAAADGVERVQVPPGTYSVSSRIEIPSGVALFGTHQGLCTIKASSALGSTSMLAVTGTSSSRDDVTIAHLTLDGNRAERTGGLSNAHNLLVVGTLADPVTNIRVENVRSINAVNQCFKFNYVHGLDVVHCEAANSLRDGMVIEYDSRNIRVIDYWAQDVGDDALAFNAMNSSENDGSVIENVVVNGLVVDRQGSTNTLGTGLKFHGCRYASATNITINGTYGSGITFINAHDVPCEHIEVSNFVIVDAGLYNSSTAGHGISFYGADTSSSQLGEAPVRDIRVANGRVINPRGNGIISLSNSATGSVTDIEIDNVYIEDAGAQTGAGSTAVGVVFDGDTTSDIRLNNVVAVRSARQGFRIGDSAETVTRPSLHRCEAWESGQSSSALGIYLVSCADPRVTECRAGNRTGTTQTYGLAIQSPTGTVVCYGNQFLDNATGPTNHATLTSSVWTTDVLQRRVAHGTGTPTTGAWTRGDLMWTTTPSSGATPGWVCTTSGSPGTWTAMANLA